MTEDFLRQLMEHLLQGRQLPKVQVERSVGPILGFFLEDVLTATLKDDEFLSGRYRMLCPEFPLIKENNRQSTNIDFLLYNEDRQALVFLELKTTSSSFDSNQARRYRISRIRVRKEGASYLLKDLDNIQTHSSESGKYDTLKSLLVNGFNRFHRDLETMKKCRHLHVIYLVPAQLKESEEELRKMNKTLSFDDLSTELHRFNREWATIRKALLLPLDSNPEQFDSSPQPESGHINFKARASFDEIKTLCSKLGAQIVVGFTWGGETALMRADLKQLQQRIYKWDHAMGGNGKKLPNNWIAGNKFLDYVKILEAASVAD
ncbi:hypothetical protein [Brachymonas denitrificans]|uniref:hypothetical protein n=1 Tax=Brachymonas denitrificans TaxID=28220 RepID=UPI001BCBB709|nr:hypothetical protein [Brachymonas denitrificans]